MALALMALCLGAALGCKSGDDDSGSGAAGMGAAGTGTGGASAGPAATFSQIFDMMYPMATNARCTACHAQPANDVFNGNLQMGMDKASVYMALVGKTSTSSRCGANRTYVVPNDPANSLLLQKLTEPPPCGSRMPLGGDMFKPDQLEMIRSWIAAGALNN